MFCMSCLVCRFLWALSPSFPLGCFGFVSTVNHLLPPATSSVTPINSMCSFTTSKTSHVLVKRSERPPWNVNIWLVDRLVVFHLSQSCPWQCHCCLKFFAAARLFYTLAVAETKCKLRRRRLWGYFMRNFKKNHECESTFFVYCPTQRDRWITKKEVVGKVSKCYLPI